MSSSLGYSIHHEYVAQVPVPGISRPSTLPTPALRVSACNPQKLDLRLMARSRDQCNAEVRQG